MDTIIEYLNNVFATLPKTKQLISLKEEMIANMEEKYNELKQTGHTENEAIGIVISEFGNIDEIIKELGIEHEVNDSSYAELPEDEVISFLEVSKDAGKFTSIGVFLCILSPAILLILIQLASDNMLLFNFLNDASTMIGIIILLVFVAIAVGLFVYSGLMIEKYNHIEKSGQFILPYNLQLAIESKLNNFQPTYRLTMIIGIGLCILSPTPLFITLAIKQDLILYSVAILLTIIAIAVYIFIYYSNIRESYKKLLKIDQYSDQFRKDNKIINAVYAVVWPLAICIFIISGFIFDSWHINWIIFPITALLSAMFSSVYYTLKGIT